MALNKVPHRLTLDLMKPGIQATMYVNVGELDSRQVIISLRYNSTVYALPEGLSVRIYAQKPDGTILYNACTISGNEIFYTLTTQTIAAEGRVHAQLQIFDADGAVLFSPEFIIVVSGVIYDAGAVASANEYDALVGLQTALTALESDVEAAEAARVLEEGERTANEQARLIAEEDREDAEALRAVAEDDRELAEGERAANEEDRETAEGLRSTVEGARATAETARASAETSRASAESARASAESGRVSAESARVSAESARVSAETGRVSAEAARGSAETSRANAESSRASVESLRVAAENARAAAESARAAAESARVAAEEARAALMAARMFIEDYSAETAYEAGNEVAYNGSTYRCIEACTNVLPTVTDNWILVARAGQDGAGSGDMLASVYAESTGVVKDSAKLGGHLPAYYVAAVAGKGLSTEDYTSTEKSKLDGIEDGANNYTHPSTHSADIIVDGTANKAYTAAEQTKLAGIAAGAEVNVQSDWNAASGDAYIANKPTLGALAAKDTVAAGDIDSNAVTTAKILDANVTSAKLANMAAYTLKGRNAETTGVPGDVTMLDVAEYSLAQGTDATGVADAEYIPISVSSTSLKKITWANVITTIKTALFSTISGIAKLNGSGGWSAAVAGTDYQAPTTINTNTNASPALGTLANNNEYRCTSASPSTAPTMTIAAIASTATEFAASVIYESPGTTAPVITNNSGYTLKYSGTNVSSGTFSPKAGTVYRISFLFDGIYLNAYVMGVA